LYATDDRITLPAFPMIGDRRVVGTYMGGGDPHADLPRLAADVLNGSPVMKELIVERPSTEVNDALDDLRAGRTLARQVLMLDERLASRPRRPGNRRHPTRSTYLHTKPFVNMWTMR
jgi:D-arabinose 1-dehydrogenase-like Zn-dependent alcohol dehydrogenase